VAAQLPQGGFQVVDIDCQVLYPDVAWSRELPALVGRGELEELDVRAVAQRRKRMAWMRLLAGTPSRALGESSPGGSRS
jgi:hypothetical protein